MKPCALKHRARANLEQEIAVTASITKNQIKLLAPENWQEKQRILVILAHPDDPEFFCGVTIARWAAAGHEVHYLLLTHGDKGAPDRSTRPDELSPIRELEERAAAAILGVKSVQFLNNPDGYLMDTLETRKAVVRVIRQIRPDVVVTCDPTNYFANNTRIQHPDHRTAGAIAFAAVFPAAGNHLFFPELLAENLEPINVKEVWVSLPVQADLTIDVTAFWEQRYRALCEHKTQIGDPAKLRERLLLRRTPDSTAESPRFEEAFRRLIMV
jgi:LmbE family N-acetylglucosaminyl deacetylase